MTKADVEDAAHSEQSDIVRLTVDNRNTQRPKMVATVQTASMYGYRGENLALKHLSPYEWEMHFDVVRVTYPKKLSDTLGYAANVQYSKLQYHAVLTSAGKDKLQSNQSSDLEPTVDYEVCQPSL